MKDFPTDLKPKNKENFPKYRYRRNLAYMRKEIFELMLKGDENNYFDLDKFARQYEITPENIESMRSILSGELEELGWKTKTSFGGSGLFIYSTDEPPMSCYQDEF